MATRDQKARLLPGSIKIVVTIVPILYKIRYRLIGEAAVIVTDRTLVDPTRIFCARRETDSQWLT